MDKQGMVKTVYAKNQPFKRIENYFINMILNWEEQVDGNEAYSKPDDNSMKALVGT